MIKCPCGFESDKQGDFIWALVSKSNHPNSKVRMVQYCFECSAMLHKNHIAKGKE